MWSPAFSGQSGHGLSLCLPNIILLAPSGPQGVATSAHLSVCLDRTVRHIPCASLGWLALSTNIYPDPDPDPVVDKGQSLMSEKLPTHSFLLIP